ncbi:MAG: IPTL-CTERM sorting domain-containing protein [Coprothermobacterota bacterium]|nr:IPTL-CTERM sorting domain-containing protein [Coprothermobacterota bacterium]
MSTSPTPIARWGHAMASTPSGVLLFGGDDGEKDSILGDTWLYGPATPPSPAGMPGLSPWALALLSIALLGAGGWWFLRRRRIGDG